MFNHLPLSLIISFLLLLGLGFLWKSLSFYFSRKIVILPEFGDNNG